MLAQGVRSDEIDDDDDVVPPPPPPAHGNTPERPAPRARMTTVGAPPPLPAAASPPSNNSPQQFQRGRVLQPARQQQLLEAVMAAPAAASPQTTPIQSNRALPSGRWGPPARGGGARGTTVSRGRWGPPRAQLARQPSTAGSRMPADSVVPGPPSYSISNRSPAYTQHRSTQYGRWGPPPPVSSSGQWGSQLGGGFESTTPFNRLSTIPSPPRSQAPSTSGSRQAHQRVKSHMNESNWQSNPVESLAEEHVSVGPHDAAAFARDEAAHLAKLREDIYAHGRYCTCISRPARRALLTLAMILSVVLVAVGSNIVQMNSTAERKHMQSTLPVTPSTMPSAQASAFLAESFPHNVYMFNYTNVYEVLTAAAKPVVQQVGPLKFNRLTYRVDIDEGTYAGETRWTEVQLFEVADQATQDQLDRKIVTFNVNYIGGQDHARESSMRVRVRPLTRLVGHAAHTGMAQVARVNRLPSDPPLDFVMPQPDAISDLDFNVSTPNTLTLATLLNSSHAHLVSCCLQLYAIANAVIPTIRSQFLSSTSTLQQALRGLLLPLYFQIATATIGAVQSVPTAQVIGEWASGNTFSAASSPAYAAFAGFALPAALSNPATQAGLLWSPANLNSWSIAAGGLVRLAQNPSLATQFAVANQLTPQDLAIVIQWAGNLTAAGFAPYETVVVPAVTSQLNAIVPFMNLSAVATRPQNADFQPHSFVDLGALQWGTGIVGSFLVQDKVALAKGAGTSLADARLLGNAAGFGSYSNTFEPMELPLGATHFPDTSGLLHPPSDPNLRLNIANSTSLLSAFGGGSTDPRSSTTTYAGFSAALRDICSNPSDVLRPRAARWSFIEASDPPTVDPTAISILQQVLNADASNAPALQAYFSRYLGAVFIGEALNIDSTTGVNSQNGGLFVVQTLRDHLFGYTNRQGVKVGAILGVDASTTTLDDAIAEARAEGSSTTYGLRSGSGTDDMQDRGTFSLFRGYTQYQQGCQFHEADAVSGCNTAFNTLVNNYQIWGAPEVILGASDGVHFAPFHDQDPMEVLYVFISEIKRVLPFTFVDLEVINGVTAARYELNQTVLNSTSIGFPYQNRWRNDNIYHTALGNAVPDGFVNISPLQGGVPVFVSLPQFLNVDPLEADKIDGMHPDVSLHSSVVYMEPLTGVLVSSQKRLMASIRLQADELTFGPNILSPAAQDLLLTSATGIYAGFFARDDHLYLPYYWSE